jgi:hypothetical protein
LTFFLAYKLFFAITIFFALMLNNHLPVYPIESYQHQKNANMEPSVVSVNNSSKSYADQIMAYCQGGDAHCPMKALNELNKTQSRQAVLGAFSDLILLYDKNNYSCHEEGHHLGMWLFDYTKNLKEALNYTTLLCGGSVFHGIFQRYFMGERIIHNEDKNQIVITQLCPPTKENVSWLYERDCVHGIGHGLTMLYDYNTTAAVDRCDEFIPLWAQSACSRGVFMENNDHFVAIGKGDFDKNDIYYPCDRTDEKFAPQCYYFHPIFLLERSNSTDGIEIFAQCDNITPTKFAKYCFQGIGRMISPIAYTDAEKAIGFCALGNQSYRNDCLIGMLKAILKQDAKSDVAFKLCSLSKLDFKAQCYEIVGMWIKAFLNHNKQEWEIECAKAPDINYAINCTNASQDTSLLVRIFEIV